MNVSIMNKKVLVYGAGVESGAISINIKTGIYVQKEYNHITNLIDNGVC